MKLTNPLAVLITSLAFAQAPAQTVSAAASAATSTTGTISGRVQNAVTSQFLFNVRVAARGTNLVVFTDQSGTYLIPHVAGGPVTLEIFYTGLDPQQVLVNVTPGQSVEQNVSLTSVARYGQNAEAVKLDSFVVAASRERDNESLATNGQRFATNIKNVLATDSFGNITEGNVAEFMKYLPGVTVEFVSASPNTVSVRGLSSSLTGVSIDGAATAQAHASNSRAFEFKHVSINNFSRIEVTKVPTPSTPADSLGGSINMVSKSAFEKIRPEFTYRLFLSINSDEVTLKATSFPSEDRTFKSVPGGEFTYSLPLTKDFGLVVTGSTSSQYNIQDNIRKTYSGSATGTTATFARPYLQQHSLVDAPKYRYHNSGSAKADWRITPHGVLSVGGQMGSFMDHNRALVLNLITGTNGTPTLATGVPMTFGDDFVIGATGRGSVSQGAAYANNSGKLKAGNLRFRFDDGRWRIDTGGSLSRSQSWNRPLKYGYFGTVSVSNINPLRVTLTSIDRGNIGASQGFDDNNREVDIYDIKNFKVTGANTSTFDVIDLMRTADMHLRRQFDRFSLPAALQIGSAYRQQTRDRTSSTTNYTYNGVNGDFSAAPYLMQGYSSGPRNGLKDIPWISPHRTYDAWLKNPSLFYRTPAQIVAEETGWISNSQYVQETVTAHYAQGELRLFQNRLTLLGGVRYEGTVVRGMGPLTDPNAVYLRNADGTFAHNAAGQRIRRPDAGAAGSLEELRLTRRERGNRVQRDYAGYYPSLHLTGKLRENVLLRAAYAETYGRPNITDIIPNSTVTENDVSNNGDPTVVLGNISLVNTGLKPWSARAYDLSAEYYTDQGGVFSAGLFRKDIKDFFANSVRIATLADTQELGLESKYVGWRLSTKYNAGAARVTGAEFSARQSLRGLGAWGQYFSAFANATKLKLDGGADADFGGFMPKSASWGFTFTKNPVNVIARWNYRGENRSGSLPTLGPDAFSYNEPRTALDLNLDYQYRRGLSFFANGRNVFNRLPILQRRGSQTPEYAKQYQIANYGVQLAVGLKGTF